MDNNAPNKPATTAHKVRMKHTYFAISFGGGSVMAVLPICLENILEKIYEKKVDSSPKRETKDDEKTLEEEPNLCGKSKSNFTRGKRRRSLEKSPSAHNRRIISSNTNH